MMQLHQLSVFNAMQQCNTVPPVCIQHLQLDHLQLCHHPVSEDTADEL